MPVQQVEISCPKCRRKIPRPPGQPKVYVHHCACGNTIEVRDSVSQEVAALAKKLKALQKPPRKR